MTDLFQGKSAAEIARAMAELKSGAQTKAQFDALGKQDAATRDFVVNALEKDILQLAQTFTGYIDQMGAATAKAAFTGTKAPDTAAAVQEEQALTELIRQVVTLKGDAVDPLVKTMAQEISALTNTQAGTENAVYGAIFDAIEKNLAPQLEEEKRLEKISDAFGWRLTIAVKEHFNAAGKYQQFAEEPTTAEKEAQVNAIKGLLWMSDKEAVINSLKATDIFMSVARRVGSDDELAALLPRDKLDAKDVEALEKNQLPSLAALVKTAIKNTPQ